MKTKRKRNFFTISLFGYSTQVNLIFSATPHITRHILLLNIPRLLRKPGSNPGSVPQPVMSGHDLAIIIFDEVPFSDQARPICLPM